MKPLSENDDYLFGGKRSTVMFQVFEKSDQLIFPLAGRQRVGNVRSKCCSTHLKITSSVRSDFREVGSWAGLSHNTPSPSKLLLCALCLPSRLLRGKISFTQRRKGRRKGAKELAC